MTVNNCVGHAIVKCAIESEPPLVHGDTAGKPRVWMPAFRCKQLNPQASPKPNRTRLRGAESDPNPNLARRNRSESEPGRDKPDPNPNSGKAIRTRGLLYIYRSSKSSPTPSGLFKLVETPLRPRPTWLIARQLERRCPIPSTIRTRNLPLSPESARVCYI